MCYQNECHFSLVRVHCLILSAVFCNCLLYYKIKLIFTCCLIFKCIHVADSSSGLKLHFIAEVQGLNL